jgi:hypothetical protein
MRNPHVERYMLESECVEDHLCAAPLRLMRIPGDVGCTVADTVDHALVYMWLMVIHVEHSRKLTTFNPFT